VTGLARSHAGGAAVASRFAVAGLAAGLALCVAPTAFGASGGSAAPGTGGTAYVATPKIKAVKCAASCMSGGRVKSGGKLKLRGAALGGVTKVVFTGAPGSRDDVAVKVRPKSDRSVSVPVPFAAQSGKLEAFAGKMHSSSRKAVTIMPPPAPEPNAQLSPAPGPADTGAPGVETATSRSLFALDQAGGVKFSFRFTGGAPTAVKVMLVSVENGDVIQTWSPTPPSPGKVGKVSWNGLSGGTPASNGRYAFRLVASTGGAEAHSAAADNSRRDAFDLRPALFPVRGKHNYGQSGARFGAGRSGHSHQGQDVMAACGTPLRAARGGVVKAKQYHSAAGNYIVIDGAATGIDMAYMHLRVPSPYKVGDRVRTGDQIGVVGDTGDATACHLHFEEWSGPGWYSGGSPFDPIADLKAWDAYS
jgi:murein DD-endopeptidase MepM/ murein hydrolase activator NlpD